MSTTEKANTHGRTRLSFASVADIDEFVATLEKYEQGELTPDQWRAFRLVRGTYGQRQAADAQMLRVKIPQGILTKEQLEALATVGERYSRRFGHITTRQNIQFHFVKLHDVEPAMRLLADAGLTTREACGNSVRNITGCPYAGVSATERFDVSEYADGLTRFLLRHPLSSTLPRKFKIAFEGCSEDHIFLGINDLGFRAEIAADGTRGFRVTAGGGTAIMCVDAGHPSRFPARLGDPARRRSGAEGVPPVRRLPAQAAQPHQVHDQVARLGPLRRRVSTRARRGAGRRRRAAAHHRSAGRRIEARLGPRAGSDAGHDWHPRLGDLVVGARASRRS